VVGRAALTQTLPLEELAVDLVELVPGPAIARDREEDVADRRLGEPRSLPAVSVDTHADMIPPIGSKRKVSI
jgi:hypothetical protein